MPSAMSWVFASLHNAVGLAFVGAVVGEYLGSSRGVGYLILQAEGTFDINTYANEIQAGSYALMDTAYGKLGLPFKQAVSVLATVISTSASGYAVANCGLKALGMDHGNPDIDGGGLVMIVSDEHITFVPETPVKVGDLIRVLPAHVDPTIADHERMHVVRDGEVLETWEVDLRGW